MRIIIAALVASLTMAAQADGIYRWVGEDGVVHFGSQPPQTGNVEVVQQPKSERFKQWQTEQHALIAAQQLATATTAQPKTSPRAEPQAANEKASQKNKQAQRALLAQRCQSARASLQELHAHPRLREVDANGKVRVLGEEERQQRIQRSQQSIKENC